jgi:predicted peptidase
MKQIILVLIFCVLIAGCNESAKVSNSPLTSQKHEGYFFEKDIVKKAELGFSLYLPEDYGTPGKEWPLVMFLHGGGERGDGVDDLQKVLILGLPKLIEKGQDYPFIMISPQCPTNSSWKDQTDELGALFDHVADTYAVDKDRLYVTGPSRGGAGTWAMIKAFPKKFAAAVPICGRGDKRAARRRLKDLPIWVFHGAKDKVIPLSESEVMVDALKAAGNEKVKFTIYPERGHNSWVPAYDTPELFEWLLSQRKSNN